MRVEDIWSDFDAIVDIDQICKITITDRVLLINRISAACAMQVLGVLSDMRTIDPLFLEDMIESKYQMWRDIHTQLLKL